MAAIDVSILVQALPYIRAFRDRTFVVKFGGELTRDREHLEAIAEDLTLLEAVGIRLVAVHGGGPQANELSELLGFKPQIVDGRRITDERALEVAKMVFAGKINTEVLSALRKHGGAGVGLSGVDAGIVKARKRGVGAIDFGFVGDVDGVDTVLIDELVKLDYIPVISSLAADDDGTILNVNADTIAAEIAIGLKAEKLLSMTTAKGVLGTDGQVISEMSAAEARQLIRDKVATSGMIPKLEACARAVEGGVKKAHIIDGLTRHALLAEVFTERGIGTMVTP